MIEPENAGRFYSVFYHEPKKDAVGADMGTQMLKEPREWGAVAHGEGTGAVKQR